MLFPPHVAWFTEIDSGVENFVARLGRETRQKIRRSMRRLEETKYKIHVEKVNKDFLQRFIPIYKKFVREKNSELMDVQKKVIRRLKEGKSYESISLYEEKNFLGGLLFFYDDVSNVVDVSYQGTEPRISQGSFSIGLGYPLEYHFLERVIELGKKRICRGVDDNPSGLPGGTTIGLADFKIRLGYNPYSYVYTGERFQETETLRTNDDSLVFLGDKPNTRITKAILLTRNLEKAKQQYVSLVKSKKIQVEIKLGSDL